MDIKLVIIIAFSYLYGFFEIFMSVRQRLQRKKDIVQSGDKKSVWYLLVLIAIGYYLAFRFGLSRVGRIYRWDTFFCDRRLFVGHWISHTNNLDTDTQTTLYLYRNRNRGS